MLFRSAFHQRLPGGNVEFRQYTANAQTFSRRLYGIAIAQTQLTAQANERVALEHELRRAIERDELSPQQIGELMHLSDKLSGLNAARSATPDPSSATA